MPCYLFHILRIVSKFPQLSNPAYVWTTQTLASSTGFTVVYDSSNDILLPISNHEWPNIWLCLSDCPEIPFERHLLVFLKWIVDVLGHITKALLIVCPCSVALIYAAIRPIDIYQMLLVRMALVCREDEHVPNVSLGMEIVPGLSYTFTLKQCTLLYPPRDQRVCIQFINNVK